MAGERQQSQIQASEAKQLVNIVNKAEKRARQFSNGTHRGQQQSLQAKKEKDLLNTVLGFFLDNIGMV